MSDREKQRELFAELEARGLLTYGSAIDGNLVRSILEIEIPEVATKATFDKLALEELGAIDYVRNVLLGRGMYIGSFQGGYRILLPSENQKQVELYMSSADKKLSRALKLSRNTPSENTNASSQIEARILLKKKSARR